MNDRTRYKLTQRGTNTNRRGNRTQGEIESACTLREIGDHQDRNDSKYSNP
ncbi:hypothetical protein [Telmatocola sphagniphila]|uniref:hypothetical protein n=1 Tax=Telmatocola sphagniphila TaxID=1123043 RepID=UPI001FE61AFA|nr:hypothetical protein [Telmatocola sphagniphila]